MKPFARMILVSSLAFAGMIAYSDTPLRGSMIAINQSDFNFYNMLRGELGDRLNAVLSAVGFNLVKLMK